MAVHKSAHFSGGLLSNVYTFEKLPHESNPTHNFCPQCSVSSVLMFGEVVSQEVDEGVIGGHRVVFSVPLVTHRGWGSSLLNYITNCRAGLTVRLIL